MFENQNPHYSVTRTDKRSTKKRVSFTVKERRLKCFFIAYSSLEFIFIVGLLIIKMSCTNLVEVPLTYGEYTLCNSLANFVFKTFIFWILMALMYKFHRFEFN